MEIILQGERAQGVPTDVVIPEFFRCSICDKEKTNAAKCNLRQDLPSHWSTIPRRLWIL
jgi:hypothetical protein